MTLSTCAGIDDLVFQHIEHTWTRPTLLAGPDGCGKTRYAIKVLSSQGYDIVELPSNLDMLDNLEAFAGGKGIVKRAILLTDFQLSLRDRPYNWSAFTHILTRVNKKTPVFAIADWSLTASGQPTPRYPIDFQKIFYVVTVRPPSPSQIYNILMKARSQAQVTSHKDLSKIAQDCNGDVRQALIVMKGSAMKDMHIDSNADERLNIVLRSPKDRACDDLIDISMIPIIFDNYLNLPLGFERSCNIAENMSAFDVITSLDRVHEFEYAYIRGVCSILSAGDRRAAALDSTMFMNSKRDNSAAVVANKQKYLRGVRNKLAGLVSNPCDEYLRFLPKLLRESHHTQYGLDCSTLDKLRLKKRRK